MVKQQLRPNEVMDVRILDAITALPRSDFLDAEFADLACSDTPLSIGYGQCMLSPLLEGKLLQALSLTAEESVLEIGTGTGHFTALLSELCRQVISVEYFAELSEEAARHLATHNIENVSLHVGDASKGWTLPDRIDVIVMTAAVTQVPETYLHALKVGGRLIAIIGEAPAMSVTRITRISEWEWQTVSLFETFVPPMIHAEPKPQFAF
jgi:protein-L-isoaspartate(D-aspartate) O-methyltransferase